MQSPPRFSRRGLFSLFLFRKISVFPYGIMGYANNGAWNFAIPKGIFIKAGMPETGGEIFCPKGILFVRQGNPMTHEKDRRIELLNKEEAPFHHFHTADIVLDADTAFQQPLFEKDRHLRANLEAYT